MDFSRYIHYTFEDFLNDDAFLHFVVEPNHSDLDAWKKFQLQYPYKSKVAVSAFETISTYRQQETFYNESSQAKLFSKITASISAEKPVSKFFKITPFLKIAAVFTVFILSAVLYFAFWNKTSFKTDFGNVKTLILPDGSKVTLNGNSKISYAAGFKNGEREAWLDGEALFEVKHLNVDTNNIKPEEKFIVHCGDLDIEVLGTTFNVKSRHNKTVVALLNGKVRLDYKDVTKTQKQFLMVPGDFVKHSGQSPLIKEKIINPAHLTAWTTRQLVFQNATLEEMIAVLQDDLGYEITLSNDKLNHLKVEGEINVGSVKELLQILSTTLHITITANNKKLTITE